MASVHKRVDGAGWLLTYGSGNSRVRRTFATRQDADAAKHLVEQHLAATGEPVDWSITVDFALNDYSTHLETNRRPATARRYRRELRTFRLFLAKGHPEITSLWDVKERHVEEFKRQRLTGGITEPDDPEDVEHDRALRAELAEGPKASSPKDNAKFGWLGRRRLQACVMPRTVNHEVQTVETFLNYCIRQHWLIANAAQKVERLRVTKKALPRFLPLQFVPSFFAACRPRERRVFGFMGASGMRPGEVISLRWSDIRPELGVILVQEKADTGWQPKTGEEPRWTPKTGH